MAGLAKVGRPRGGFLFAGRRHADAACGCADVFNNGRALGRGVVAGVTHNLWVEVKYSLG